MTASLVGSNTFGFADGNGGHVCNLGSAPAVGQLDVLCVNSDTVVSTPAGFTVARSEVNAQGSYLFYRKAVGGEAATVTVTTSGNFNAQVSWSRWANVNAFNVSTGAQAQGPATVTPTQSTGALAEANELVVAFGALHDIGAGTPSAPVWSAGYTGLTSVLQGTINTAVVGYVGYRTDAGPAAQSPVVNWTSSVNDRYILIAAFTSLADTATGTGVFDVTMPAVTVAIDAAAEAVDADFSLTMPAATVTITATSPAPPIPPISPERMNFGPVLASLLECVCDALAEAEVPVCTCMITVGAPTGDYCNCACPDGSGSGQLAIYVASTFLSASFPDPAPANMIDKACGPGYLVANIVIELLRCYPTGDQSGKAPLPATLIAAALAQMTDASLVRQAVGCCLVGLKDARTIPRFSIGQQTTVEPQGGCAGSGLAIQVALPACICAGS